MASQPGAGAREHHARKRIQWLLILAAALPLLTSGMFAGLALGLVIAVWLFRVRESFHAPILWVLTTLVVIETLVFSVSFLR